MPFHSHLQKAELQRCLSGLTSAGRADLLLLLPFLTIFNSKKLFFYLMAPCSLVAGSLEREVHRVKQCSSYPHFRGLTWTDEAGLVSQKPVMSLPQSVTSLCVLCHSVYMSFPPFPPKCTMEPELGDCTFEHLLCCWGGGDLIPDCGSVLSGFISLL